MKTRVERRTRFARPVGSGRALRGRTSSSWRVRSPSSYRRFRVFTRHITLRRGDDTAGPHANAHQRGARRFRDPPREPRLGSGSRGCARGRVRSRESGPAGTLGRTLELAKTARARTRERRSHARARRTRGVRCGRLRGEGRVEAFRGSADASALPGTGDTARRRRFSGFPRRIRLRPSATVHHEAAGGVEDAQAVHDYQEP